MEEQYKTTPTASDFNFDDIDETPSQNKQGVEQIEVVSAKVSPEIMAMLSRFKQQNTSYVDMQMTKIVDMVKVQNVVIEEHDARITSMQDALTRHADILESLSSATSSAPSASASTEPVSSASEQPAQRMNSGSVIGSTLGAVGGVLHTVVDTAAFILESAVDLATFGRARRTPGN